MFRLCYASPVLLIAYVRYVVQSFDLLRHTSATQQQTYCAYDKRVLALLPDWAQYMFPALLTARSGVDLQVVLLMRFTCIEKISRNGFQKILKQQHHDRYHVLMMQFYSKLAGWRTQTPAFLLDKPTWFQNLVDHQFHTFEEHGGFVPSCMCDASVCHAPWLGGREFGRRSSLQLYVHTCVF